MSVRTRGTRPVARRRLLVPGTVHEPSSTHLPSATVAGSALVLRLQRDAGNAAVAGWLQRSPESDEEPITATGREGAALWMQRGLRQLRSAKYDDAAASFREGYELYPSHKLLLNEAAALFDGDRYAQAITVYKQYLADPEANRKPEARAQIVRARKAMPQQIKKDFAEGQAHYLAGRYDEALDRFDRVYAAKRHPDIRYNQAAALHRMGKFETAAQRYEMYLAEAPNARDGAKVRAAIAKIRNLPIPLSGYDCASEYMKRGNRLLAAGEYAPAIEAFEEAYRAYPSHKLLLNKASALMDSGAWAEAILAYESYLADPAVQSDDSRVEEVNATLAKAHKRMGGREASVTNVDASYKLLPKARDKYLAGEYGPALELYERAYELNPLADIRYNQAACLQRMGRKLLAASRYERYLEEKPDASDARKVRKQITKLRAEAKESSRGAFDRGQEAYLNGRYHEAADLFLEAFEQSGLPALLYNRAAALDKAEDKAAAIRAYAWYLQLEPTAADAGKVRARIRKLQEETGTELMVP